MNRAYIYILISVLFFGVGCTADHNPVDSVDSNNFDSSLIHEFQENEMEYSSIETDSDSVNSFSPTTSSFDEPCDPATCIDPPGSGGSGPSCTPTDLYRLEAKVNNVGAYVYDSNIPTWKLSPFWGGIVLAVEEELQNFEQNSTSLLKSTPHYQTFDLDYKVEVETTVMPNGKLDFSVKLFDLSSRLWFSSTVFYLSNLQVKLEASTIEIRGTYLLSQDSLTIYSIEFGGLNAEVESDTSFGPIVDFMAYLIRTVYGANNSQIAGSIESSIQNNVTYAIESVNRNSPNMFIRSIIDYPETSNVLTVLDLAINELLQDDVSAFLEVELPSCGDIIRDGLIKLQAVTN